MARRKAQPNSEPSRKIRPATTPEARENQLISLAYDLVEARLRDGTASASETTQLLKQGSLKMQLELKKLEKETALISSKKDALESSQRMEQMYTNALNAMRAYSGQKVEDDDPDILGID